MLVSDRSIAAAVTRRPPVVPGVVAWAFYLFVLSLVFEIPERGIPIEFHSLTGALLLAAALLHSGRCFRRPPVAFWLFVVYFYVYLSLGFASEHPREFVVNVVIFAQLLGLFWVSASLLQHPDLARRALWIFVAGCLLIASLQMLGVTRTVAEPGADVSRLTVLGQNPNTLAHNLAFGVVALVGVTLGATRSRRLPLLLVAGVGSALLALTIAATGSRGGLLAVVAGLVVLGTPRGSTATKVRNLAIVMLLVTGVGAAAYRSSAMRARFGAALESGDLAQRESIYPAAWQMFLDKPLLGWGPVNHKYELENRVPRAALPYRETHNVVLEVLTETGIVGGFFFLAAMLWCVADAWRGRAGLFGLLPLALVAATLVTRMGTAGLYTKTHWFALALGCASARAVRDRR